MALASVLTMEATAQKKVKAFSVCRVLSVPARDVWRVVGEDYGAVAHSHPKIVSSAYIDGSLIGGEGAERVCNFNEKGTKYLKERMVDFNPEEMRFTNQVFQAGQFPVDPEVTRAVYSVQDLGDGTSRLRFDMQYRTKPAFLGGLMKSSFIKLIEDYVIAIEHHVKTGEKVTKDNFKSIKKLYDDKSPTATATGEPAVASATN